MKCFKVLLLTILMLAFIPLQYARAQEEDLADLYGDEEFVSIATGNSKPITKAPAVASVITAKEIEAMGATTLNQVLERVPGLHVALSTQGRLDSVYSIRGIHTKFNPQVLVLMNGIPFPIFTGGRPFHFNLPVAAIARIEIIRGPGSAIYGADAFAGVVNIITKAFEDINGTEIGEREGSFDTHDLWLLHGRTLGDWDIAFSLEWQHTDGDKDRRVSSDLQTALDTPGNEVSRAPGPLNTRYNILDTHLELKRDDWRLGYWYWRQDDAGMGAGSALALDPDGGEDFDQHLVDLSYRTNDLAENWDLGANLNYLHRYSDSRFVLLPAGTNLPIGPDGNLDLGPSAVGIVTFPDGFLGNPSLSDESAGLDLVALYTGIVPHRLRFGLGVKNYKVRVTHETKNFGTGVIDGTTSPVNGTLTDVANTPYVFLPDSSRTVWYVSFQDEWQVGPDWELTAGVRYDEYSDVGNTINPRLALVWSTLHNLTTKLLYGRAFRAPSFNEQFSTNNPVALGNSGLDPETIDTVELAFDYRPMLDMQTVFSLFGYQAKGLIEFVPDPGGRTITAQNARDQNGYGFELELSWDATKDLRLSGNYAFQHSEDDKTGKRIADAPGQQIFLSADWQFLPDWTLHPQINWVADRKRAPEDPRPDIDDYTLVDLTLRRQRIAKHWDFALSLRNIFDKDAREPSTITIPDDYPLEGRNIWAEIRYRF